MPWRILRNFVRSLPSLNRRNDGTVVPSPDYESEDTYNPHHHAFSEDFTSRARAYTCARPSVFGSCGGSGLCCASPSPLARPFLRSLCVPDYVEEWSTGARARARALRVPRVLGPLSLRSKPLALLGPLRCPRPAPSRSYRRSAQRCRPAIARLLRSPRYRSGVAYGLLHALVV